MRPNCPVAALPLIAALWSCGAAPPPPPAPPSLEALRFPRRVETISPGVHVALGYGLANVIKVLRMFKKD
jgi:hypothetical protein